MRLELCTWQEVERYLGAKTAIVVPIGSTEQHGPNGLIGTDAICPQAVAQRVGEALEVLVAPTLAYGQSQHHLGFPGTVTLRPSTLAATVRDVVASLERHGFRSIYFLNGHGGNMATVQAAFGEIWAEASLAGAEAPRLRLRNWWSGRRFGDLAKELFGASDGDHATASEVSASWSVYPDSVKQVAMTPKVAPRGPIRDAADYRRRFPDGRIGSDPSLASVEHGTRLLAASVEDVVEDLQRFIDTA